ncbi:PAS-domain containing protein [Histidinibacterium aquaticum]|uniref:PAS domain-containing protein n=1 Tax=Histidinibacterium aquaticum TaxID=2613962 RepID=A0A5J5GGC0_9RHOB|nr:PAS-domain containing protein [Histidinibacterium aquaticum]KAA9006802.1 PAS domain-containing protein [Histidinibacterium aquaticum]
MTSTLAAALVPVAISLLAVVTVLLARRTPTTPRQLLREAEGTMTFLLDGDRLEDATPTARRLLEDGATPPDREDLVRMLTPAFPRLRAVLDDIESDGATRLVAEDRTSSLEVEYWDGFVRLTLHQDDGTVTGPSTGAARDAELDTLRAIAEDAPQLIWSEDESGAITWANGAYLELDRHHSHGAERWPPGRIFGALDTPDPGTGRLHRRLAGPATEGERADWYDVTTVRRPAGTVHFAVDADAVVKAEEAQRGFVQTLSKTFADLATGLAIFDRDRRLVMFNPALMELTALPVDFLATQPRIHAFLDRLREQRMLPEPRDYRSWREEIVALESEAANGRYCETWALPDGQIYRVTGRPHPDGAIAFLIEDITAEMSLTRRFRTQIDTSTAILDSLDEAIAVFSPSGVLTLANRAYDSFWPHREEADAGAGVPIGDLRLRDELERWKIACVPTDVWRDIRNGAMVAEDRRPWTAALRRDDGRQVTVRVQPLPAGATMVGFSSPAAAAGPQPVPHATGPVALSG